ncbi:hypothetical protein X943_003411 [Babesia divergens]|uniref:U3 small nucleolar RNA-associated protein 20 domain-containing protein n=1 Tax=Babesia divergens TaxID=32595 RepID=A0AAD9GAM1_BABDI|nr:hypothetical protein X943_003411 [Babesia divergens]
MTNPGKFKYVSSSKRSRTLAAAPFGDIGPIIASDGPVDKRRFFLQSLRNTLRCKDLIKHKQILKDILNKCQLSSDLSVDSTLPFSKWSDGVVSNLLSCAESATNLELKAICRLLAIFFKDYGDQGVVAVPFETLLRLLEKNPDANAEPIFSFLSTHFSANSRCVGANLDGIVVNMDPWLRHKHILIRRLSMETLSLLLRRLTEDKDGSEHLLFGIIKNVHGTFTTKLQPIFKFLLSSISSCDVYYHEEPDVLSAVSRIATAVRHCLGMMSRHCKGRTLELEWLDPLYEDCMGKFKEATLCTVKVSAYSIAAELCVEMFATFRNKNNFHIKDMVLVKVGPAFDAILTHYLIPLLSFAKDMFPARHVLLDEICHLLVRVVRTPCDATNVLDTRFADVLDNLICFIDDATDITHLMVLLEWRLKSDNLRHISHFLLVISNLFDSREVFHLVLVNPVVNKRILDCITAAMDSLTSMKGISSLEEGSPSESDYVKCFYDSMSIVFGCLRGLSSISSMRSKMKAAPISLDKTLLENILKECFSAFKTVKDSKLNVEVILQCLYLMDLSDRSIWIQCLVDAVKDDPSLLSNHRLLDELTLNFSQSMLPLSHHILSMLPNVECNFRQSCLRFFLAYFDAKGVDACSLRTLLDMESLDPSLENERRKSLLMTKCVETLDLDTGIMADQELLILIVSKTLLSQYYVKFAPLWQATFEAYSKLVLHLVNTLTGSRASFRKTLLDSLWNDCFSLINGKITLSVHISEALPSFVLPFLPAHDYESTDEVTMQRELLSLMARNISYMGNKESYLRILTSYTYSQLVDESKEAFRKQALATVSTLLQKYPLKEGMDELVDLCLREVIRSNDPIIRESCLFIIATKYPGVDVNRLHTVATGTDQQITNEEDSISYSHLKDSDCRELSIGIAIRMLCPRILQYSKQLHGKSIFDHLATLKPRYLSLLIVEFIPGCFSSLFFKDAQLSDDSYRMMVERLDFIGGTSGKPSLHRGIRTLCVIVKRLKKNLHMQALPLLEFCCGLLSICIQEWSDSSEHDHKRVIFDDCNVDSVVSMTITLMTDVVNTFDSMFQSFLDILSKHTALLKALLDKNKDVLQFVVCLTARTDYINDVCRSVLASVFPYLFKRSATPQVISIIENTYCQYSSQAGEASPFSEDIICMLVCHASTVVDCIKDYKPLAAHIVKGILCLPVDDSLRHVCLSILLNNLPNVKAMRLHKVSHDTSRYDLLRGLRRLLESINMCVFLLTIEDVSTINRIWDFVNECLFYVGDMECRRITCSILGSLPVKEAGLEFISMKLLSMNTGNSGSMDTKIDLDLNCQHLSSLCDELKDHTISAKVLYTSLLHSLFLLLSGHADPGVRRCVLKFTFAIMDIISSSLSSCCLDEPLNYPNVASNCDYMDMSTTPFVILLFKGIFPFIQRCISGLRSRGSLFTIAIDLLEQFSMIFSGDIRLKSFFNTRLHGDLLCNHEFVECLSNLRGVQKYNRNEGLKQLRDLLRRDDVFSSYTTYRLLVPLCIQFMLQSESSNYALFRETSRDCLIECGGKLSPSMLLKFLRLLVDAYQGCKITTFLEVFSAVVRKLPVSRDSGKSSFISVDVNYERSQLVLQKLRRMLMRSQPNGDDLACPDVFEALGALLRHYTDDTCERETIKYSRLIGKLLCSRSRAARRYARISIIKFLQSIGFRFFPLVLKELASALNRGFQLQVLIFTAHSMLSSLFESDPSLKLSRDNGLPYMLQMITNELLMRQERGEKQSKIDEGRHPKALTLIELLGKFGDLYVCISLCSYLWSLLKGTCKMPPGGSFEYSNKFLHTVEHLISGAIRGFIANYDVDLYWLGNSLFYGYLAYVRGMTDRIEKQLPPNVVTQYKMWIDVARNSLKHEAMEHHEGASPVVCDADKDIAVNTKKEDHYMLYPGTSTGRSLPTMKKPGFDDRIVAPLFVNAALRLYNHILSVPENVFNKNVDAGLSSPEGVLKSSDCDLSESSVSGVSTAFGILLCFICEDVKLQRSSASCMIHLCDANNAFLKTCGTHLADHLIERLGTMQYVGSEDLAKDHLRLASMLLRSNSSSFLFNAWKKSGKCNELVDGLLLQIETNIDRPGIQVPLLKLYMVLVQLEVSSSRQSKSLYDVFNEIFVRMLKGTLTPAALRVSARVVAMFLSQAPMDESNRTKRFGMLLKHLSSSSGIVRLGVLQCIHHFLKGLSKKGAWKRYSEMVAVAITMQLTTENDVQCKRHMATILTLIWVEGSSDHKKEFLECVAHFLNKSSGCKDAVFAYVLFHCISQGASITWLRKSRILEVSIPFLGGFDRVDTTDISRNSSMWQFQYYWLRLLLHLLNVSQEFEFIRLSDGITAAEDPTTFVMNKVWRYAVMFGIKSSHPWIKGASIRLISQVLCNSSAYDCFSADYCGDIYELAKPCLKLLSTESSMVERHEKVGAAVQDYILVLLDQVLRRASKSDKTVERLVSKLCYSLRVDLGKPRHCYRRIDILLSIMDRFARDTRVYQNFLRAAMLRMMIALTRATACKAYYRLPKSTWVDSADSDSSETSVSISDLAYKIMSKIEAGFNAINEGSEFLKLLGFSRDFVLRRKMLKRTKGQLVRLPNAKSVKMKRKGRKRRRVHPN